MTIQINSKILGTGSYVPKNIMTNADLEKIVDTSNEWIVERSGIKERRIASIEEHGETTSFMAAEAGKKAIEAAGLKPDDIDCIILATVSPDKKLPSASSLIQQKIGMKNECPCLDLVAACTGFIYGLVVADSMVKTGVYKNILVLGAESLSPLVDWKDRTTCVLFSDGAGAAVLGRNEGDESSILSSKIACDGTGSEFLKIDAGGTELPENEETLKDRKGFITMEGRQVFKYATRTLSRNAEYVLEQSGVNAETLDWLVPHQANIRIIEYIAKKLKLDFEKIVVTIEKYGNNSSATIPIAFDEAIRDGRIKRGQTVLLDSFGAGVTSGAILLKY